ncbi:unnamed protein product, partial [Choristocarpus tenellus]
EGTQVADSGDKHVTSVRALMYTATTDNPNFSLSKSSEEAAMVIAQARGPRGPNYEYLFSLWEYLHKV